MTGSRRSADVAAIVAFVLVGGLALSRIGHWLLEADQARIYFEAWSRSAGHQLPNSTFERTSWLYVVVLSTLLDLGVSLHTLPLVSSIFGAVAFVGLFAGIRRLTGGEYSLQLAALYVLVPGLGLISMNGYPTLLATMAVVSFATLTVQTRATLALGLGILSIALLLKADILLVFPGVLLWKATQTTGSRHLRLRQTGGWLAVMVASFVPLVILQQTRGASTEFASSWSESFPFTLAALSHPGNWANVAAPGLGTLVLVVIGAVASTRSGRPELARWGAAAVWIAVPVVFWGLIVGNSTRHLVPALPPTIWAASRAFVRWPGVVHVALLVVVGLLNVFPSWVLADPPFDGNTRRAAARIDTAVDNLRTRTAAVLETNVAADEISLVDSANREYALFEFLVRHPDATLLEQRPRAYGPSEYMLLTTLQTADSQRVSFWYVPRGDFGLFSEAMHDSPPNVTWASAGTFKDAQLATLAVSG